MDWVKLFKFDGFFAIISTLIICTGILISPAIGQEWQTSEEIAYVNSSDLHMHQQNISKNHPILSRIISLNLGDVTLGEALEKIAQNVGLEISYSGSIVPLDQPIKVDFEDITVDQAIWKLIGDTNLRYAISEKDNLVIFKEFTLPKRNSEVAQTGRVEGTVVDAGTGDPLPGATVILEDSEKGTATDAEGNYELSGIESGTYILQVSFIGYQRVEQEIEILAEQTITVNIELQQDIAGMDEVVVTGQAGFSRQREVGNSISKISSDQIESQHIANFGDLMQGRVAGATIQQNTGQIGGGSSIRLRGINSITQGNSPLVYVDGVRMSNRSDFIGIANTSSSPLNDINPQDIERMEIIKGPAATTLYGTEASGGVIQIFTKSGSEGAPEFNFKFQQGVNKNKGGTQDFHAKLPLNDCTDFPGCPEDGNWLQNGHIQKYDLSMSGGIDNVNYFISGNWGNEQGVIGPQASETINFRGNFGITPLEDLTIRWSNNFSNRNTTWIPSGNYFGGFLLNVLRGEFGNAPNDNNSFILEEEGKTRSNKYTTGLSLDFTPTNNQVHQLKVGLDYLVREYTRERPFGNWISPLGQRESDTRTERNMTLEYLGSLELGYSETINSTLSWGLQFYNDEIINLSGTGQDFTGPGEKVVNSGARTTASEDITRFATGGFFGQKRIGWRDRAFLTLGLRVDGHSTFGEDFGLAPYPKISGSYLISENDFWPSWWESLKLRAAWGESGQAPGAFDYLRTYSSVAGDDGQPGVSPNNFGNPKIGPERSREIELGYEASFLQGRITSNFTWYKQRTYDALINTPSIPSNGFIQSQLQNVGEIEGKGIELEVDGEIIRSQNISWSIGGHISTNYSKAIDLGGLSNISIGRNQDIRVGYPVPAAFGQVVVNSDEVGAEPVFEEQYLGPNYPTEKIGLNTTTSIRERFTLNVLFEAHLGHSIFSGLAYQNTRRGIWPACSGIQEQIEAGNTSNVTAGEIGLCDPSNTTEGMWYQDADFLKLRSLSLSYLLPNSWIPTGMQEARLRFQAQNLFTLTDYPGLDPESFEDGDQLYRHEYYNLPPNQTFVFSVDLKF